MKTSTLFLSVLAVVAPVVATAGVSAGGVYAPLSLSVAGAGASITAGAAFRELRHGRAPTRLRMLTLTASVAVTGAALAVGALIWLALG